MAKTTAPAAPDNNPKKPDTDQVEMLKKMARERGLIPELLGSDDDLQRLLNSERQRIRLPGDNRELGHFAGEIGKIVKTRHLFRRDRTPVMVNHEKERLDIMTAEMLRTWVEMHLVCFKVKGQKSESEDQPTFIEIRRTMNLDTARGTLEALQFWMQLPEIKRINFTRLPVMTDDRGIELLKPGYFIEQGIYTLDDGLKIDLEMSSADAKEFIDDRLKDFPFPDARSRAVALAAMLTMFCATMLPKRALRPGFVCTANTAGAGKTLLMKMCIMPVSGSVSLRTLPRKEEAKKVLDIAAMEAANYILFDNIRGKITGEEIEAFITSPEWEGRILGESTKFRVENIATVFFTGNQSTTSADMQERCLFVELFVEEADNRDRVIPRVIDDSFLSVPEERARWLAALWALVRDWDAGGRKNQPKVLMPRFEAWSQIVPAIVISAGYGDPLAKPEIVGIGDVEIQEMRSLVKALAPGAEVREGNVIWTAEADIDAREWKFADIIELVIELGLFADLEVRAGRSVEDMFSDGEITPAGKSHFGKLLTRYDHRLFAIDGRMLRFIVEGKGNTRKFVVRHEQREGKA